MKMIRVKSFLRLVRYRNLIIVALTQYMIRFAIVSPILRVNGFELQLGEFYFFLLVSATLFITAAGYVINDYFDTRTDMLNRPDNVIIGREITRRTAIILHWVLNTAGIIIGFFLAFHIGIVLSGFLFVFVAGLLWFYSTTYSRQFLVGNIVIALLTAMVPVIVVLFEIPLLNKEYGNILKLNEASFNYIFAWAATYGYFAFLTTLIRELIKDIEDCEGDMEQGRRSVPIVLGINYTKLIIGGLIVLTLISLAYVYKAYLMIGFYGETDYLSMMYFVAFLFIPFALLFYKTVMASSRNEYRSANNLAKLIMLMGLLYGLLVRFIIISSF